MEELGKQYFYQPKAPRKGLKVLCQVNLIDSDKCVEMTGEILQVFPSPLFEHVYDPQAKPLKIQVDEKRTYLLHPSTFREKIKYYAIVETPKQFILRSFGAFHGQRIKTSLKLCDKTADKRLQGLWDATFILDDDKRNIWSLESMSLHNKKS